MKVVVVDLDGTLCDSAHRVHLAQAAQWDEFHSLLSLDKPFNDVRFLLDVLSLHGDISLIALTGRNESYRNQTYRWFNEHGIIFDHISLMPDILNTFS